jgi:ADP-ribose pyrophosphatase YjhB (NUDIX family)
VDIQPQWLLWARELQAVAQVGLTYTQNIYDRERYEALRTLSAKIMAEYSGVDAEKVKNLFRDQAGYATPKVDVRGAVFHGCEVLLVQEIIDGGRWTLPGGWADVNATPSENAVREVREEAGLTVTAKKLAIVCDRDKAGHLPPYPFHIYKLFFLCEAVGVCAKKGGETGEARYFPVDDLPNLSTDRVLPGQIRRLYEHSLNPSLPTDFD